MTRVHNEIIQWIVIAVLAFGGGYIVTNDHKRAATDQDIQAERAASIRRNCKQENDRNLLALGKTLELLGDPRTNNSRHLTKKQQDAQREATIEWVNSLVPRQNCDELVALSVKAKAKEEKK